MIACANASGAEITVIQEEMFSRLNDGEVGAGDYVLYRMQSSVRAHHNQALEHAVDLGEPSALTHPFCPSARAQAERDYPKKGEGRNQPG